MAVSLLITQFGLLPALQCQTATAMLDGTLKSAPLRSEFRRFPGVLFTVFSREGFRESLAKVQVRTALLVVSAALFAVAASGTQAREWCCCPS